MKRWRFEKKNNFEELTFFFSSFFSFYKNEKLETRLQGIRNGTRKLTVEDKKRADAKLEANRKQWRIRKQWFKESWAQISENLPPKKVKEVLEDLCVETDELANVCYETQLTELMN
ncbi:hypothetical protein BDR26DRAFT_548848 [Obelidium mucronatum]|nr:hypothetical protein BDR26DRAFT_548848 [Obelidium mucronatum]